MVWHLLWIMFLHKIYIYKIREIYLDYRDIIQIIQSLIILKVLPAVQSWHLIFLDGYKIEWISKLLTSINDNSV